MSTFKSTYSKEEVQRMLQKGRLMFREEDKGNENNNIGDWLPCFFANETIGEYIRQLMLYTLI